MVCQQLASLIQTQRELVQSQRELVQSVRELERRLSREPAETDRGAVLDTLHPAQTEEELQAMEHQLKDKEYQRKMVSSNRTELP